MQFQLFFSRGNVMVFETQLPKLCMLLTLASAEPLRREQTVILVADVYKAAQRLWPNNDFEEVDKISMLVDPQKVVEMYRILRRCVGPYLNLTHQAFGVLCHMVDKWSEQSEIQNA